MRSYSNKAVEITCPNIVLNDKVYWHTKTNQPCIVLTAVADVKGTAQIDPIHNKLYFYEAYADWTFLIKLQSGKVVEACSSQINETKLDGTIPVIGDLAKG